MNLTEIYRTVSTQSNLINCMNILINEWAKELLLTRYSRGFSISLMLIPLTELQFSILFFMKHLADPGNIFQKNNAL